jgi:hypothetical protein
LLTSKSIGAGLLCLAIAGCGGGVGPFKDVLVCLHNREEVQEYKGFLEQYASSNKLTYTDNTDTRLALALKHDRNEYEQHVGGQYLYSVMESGDGFSFLISNWDHSETTIAHSFITTADLEPGEVLADNFLTVVESKWEVIELPVKEMHTPQTCEDARALNNET